MSDLTTKQSVFSKMRNRVVNAGLKNRFIRNIMANTAPITFGYRLTKHVLDNDNQNLDGTMELLSSMKEKAIEANFSRIMSGVKNKIYENEKTGNEIFNTVNSEVAEMDYSYITTEKIVNKILDTVNSQVAELVSVMMIKDNFLDSSVTNETCKRIVDTIDCQNKQSTEIDELLGISSSVISEKIAFYLFENLTLEQKKENFSKFILFISSLRNNEKDKLSRLFEQFPEDDRLEQYKKILAVYGDENNKRVKNIKNLSECFKMLSEEERLGALKETFEQIKNSEDYSKGNYLSEIIGIMSVNEQKQYYKEVLEYCNTTNSINAYVKALDKSLHGEIVFDVISKMRQIVHQNSSFYKGQRDFQDAVQPILKTFDAKVVSDALIDIINRSVDDSDIGFVLELLSKNKIEENIEIFKNNNSITTQEQLNALQQKGFDIDNVAVIFANAEYNRILNEYSKNLGKERYIEAMKEISEVAKDVKLEEKNSDYAISSTSDFITEKKLDTYVELFSKLRNKYREQLFQDTLNAMLEQTSNNFDPKLGDKIEKLYGLLDGKEQGSQFPSLVSCVDTKYGISHFTLNFIDNLIKTRDPNTLDSIYSQYINMFNRGNEFENYKKAIYVLLSDKFFDELIDKISKDENMSFLTEEKLGEILKHVDENRGDKIAKIFVKTRLNKIKNRYNNLGENAKIQNVDEVLRELSKQIEVISNKAYYVSITNELQINTIKEIYMSLDKDEKTKHFNALFESLNNIKYKQTDAIEEIYMSLDKDEQVKYFYALFDSLGNINDENRIKFVNMLVETKNPNTLDLIYSQYINMFNEGIESENCKKAIYGLSSHKFIDGLMDKISKDENMSFLTEEKLGEILKHVDENEGDKIVEIFVKTRLNKIKNRYNKLEENTKIQNVDEVLRELSKQIEVISNKAHYESITNELQINTIKEIFMSLDKDERANHFNALFDAFGNIKNKNMKREAITLFRQLDDDTKVDIFKNCIMSSSKNLEFAVEILEEHSIQELNKIFKGELTLDIETISKLITLQDSSIHSIAIKILQLDKEIDSEKIIELSSYKQLNHEGKAITINSIIQNLFANNLGKSKQEINQFLSDTYNLFTYNNVPVFMKDFRMFQLGSFYNKENTDIKSFEDKTNAERDKLILEDLFKISLDSNSESLRNFCNILIEGKSLTTRLQGNPEGKIKDLFPKELALLYQYRDTLFDLHNLTTEIKKTERPKIKKTNNVIEDFRSLISIYSDEKHNPNSKNIIFDPYKIMNELFEGFITTNIRPRAMLKYMDRRKADSDKRHLKIEEALRNGKTQKIHIQEGDFIKGISNLDEYIPSMLRDGIKGGEFNQENSHSDFTPLDADFGYVSKENLEKAGENATDYEVIQTTYSSIWGPNFIVLKKYAGRLKDREKIRFNEENEKGNFTGFPDYYKKDGGESETRYIRTGIPITDVDYIVSGNWNPKNGYEMAMAGIYIPVIDSKGEIVFSSDDYKKIREEMRGLSYYGAEDLEVSKYAKNMDALYEVYRSVSSKSPEEINEELKTVQGLVEGKKDDVTEQKKSETTLFIKDFFKKHGITVTDELSQNLSSSSIELIDTGSTGRGTNVPGDGDFDFMLRHNLSPEILRELSDKIKTLTPEGNFINVRDGFRAKDVTLPSGEVVDIDITTAKKSLALSYSSDMCVRDRLKNIKENNPESYNFVQANIIMAKKILKAKGIYKKLGSDGATEHGGFGGIGVENWILQNGGSFKQAIDTFLEAANEASSYDEFKKKYPIFDFGFNHREGNVRHDRFSAFFANDPDKPSIGYKYVKDTLTEIKKELESEKQKQGQENMESPLMQSISGEGFSEAGKKKSVLRDRFSYFKTLTMVSKFMSLQKNVEVEKEETQSDLEEIQND